MSYILLTDQSECPACRRPHGIAHSYGECRQCGMMLFDRQHDWEGYANDTGWRELWVYTKNIGWAHYTQLKMRLEAQERVVETEAKPTISHKEQIDKIRHETKEKQRWYLKQKRTIKSFGRSSTSPAPSFDKDS